MASERFPDGAVSSKTALLVVDMVSDFEFEDGDKLFESTMSFVEGLANLKRRLKARKIPVIYVNDDLGSGRDRLARDLEALERRSKKAAEILTWIRPEIGDHWIVKPQRSGFYGTALGSLLLSLGVDSTVVTGVTTDICVLFTAHDAYMRGYSVNIPSDCCAAVERSHHDHALSFLDRVAKANTSPTTTDRWQHFFNEIETYREFGDDSGGVITSSSSTMSAAPV